jgi:hypothetical protein
MFRLNFSHRQGVPMLKYLHRVISKARLLYVVECVYEYTVVPPYPLIQFSRFTAVRKENRTINLLKPTGYGMHQQVEYFNNCTLFPHCIYVFCI